MRRLSENSPTLTENSFEVPLKVQVKLTVDVANWVGHEIDSLLNDLGFRVDEIEFENPNGNGGVA